MYDDLRKHIKRLTRSSVEDTFLNHLKYCFSSSYDFQGIKYDDDVYVVWKKFRREGFAYPVFTIWIQDKIIIDFKTNHFGKILGYLRWMLLISFYSYLCYKTYTNDLELKIAIVDMVIFGTLFLGIFSAFNIGSKLQTRSALELLIEKIKADPKHIEAEIEIFTNDTVWFKKSYLLRIIMYIVCAFFVVLGIHLAFEGHLLGSIPFFLLSGFYFYSDIAISTSKKH